jgi:probable HAF family extracellular repeat protein
MIGRTRALVAALISVLTAGSVTHLSLARASSGFEASLATGQAAEPWSAGRYTYTDLGVLGSPVGGPESSAAWSINNAGQIVGASTTTLFGASHAFLWQDGELIDLGTLSGDPFGASAAYGINDAGTIVGQTNVDPASEPPHAFRDRDGAMRDLGTGFGAGSFSRAWDNNDSGAIVGEQGRSQSSPARAFLWRNGRFRELGTLGGSTSLTVWRR